LWDDARCVQRHTYISCGVERVAGLLYIGQITFSAAHWSGVCNCMLFVRFVQAVVVVGNYSLKIW
jgi:hypothetical protein